MLTFCRSQTPHYQDGPWSWLVCFAATMSWMAAVGFVFSFGVFFPVFMEHFNEDRERTAWVGSLSIALVFFTGPVSGILVNKLGCRITNILGGLICAASLAIASMSERLVTLYLSYSSFFGIGVSFVFNAGLVIVSNYFSRRRSLALGFVSAGQGLGVLAQGPLLQTIIDKYDWKTTYRIMAGVIFAICLLGITFDPNVKSNEEEKNTDPGGPEQSTLSPDDAKANLRKRRRRRTFVDLSVWKVPTFVALTLSSSIAQFGHFVPQIHLVRFCEDLGITADMASKLYIYYGLSSAIARVLAGRLCDIRGINPVYLYQSAEFVVGLSTILVTLANDYTAMIVFVVIYGFCDGIFITTLNIILLTSVDASKRAAALGWNMQFTTIFMASGPPLAGLVADKLGSYSGAFYMAGSVVMFGAMIPFALLLTKRRVPRKDTDPADDMPGLESMVETSNTEEASRGPHSSNVTDHLITTFPGTVKDDSESENARPRAFSPKESLRSYAHSPTDDALELLVDSDKEAEQSGVKARKSSLTKRKESVNSPDRDHTASVKSYARSFTDDNLDGVSDSSWKSSRNGSFLSFVARKGSSRSFTHSLLTEEDFPPDDESDSKRQFGAKERRSSGKGSFKGKTRSSSSLVERVVNESSAINGGAMLTDNDNLQQAVITKENPDESE